MTGLTTGQANELRARFGPNEIREHTRQTRGRVLLRQVESPLVLLLVFAAIASAVTGEWVDGSIVGTILVASVGVGYRREYRAETAIAALLRRIEVTAQVMRDERWSAIPIRDIVPGDIVRLGAGSIVPADGELLDATELHLNESALTGESFPVERVAGDRVRFGTNVRSGTARYRVVTTGAGTEFGTLAKRLALRPPETEFQRGLRRFGTMLLVSMLVMVVVVFAVDTMLGRPIVTTLMFAIALAVGLSPELLPAIIGVNLSHAAQELAAVGVLCRRLDAVENLGSMDVLCTDKTGTLTEGVASIDGAFDARGVTSTSVMELALLNAALQTGLANPIDAALLENGYVAPPEVVKRGEMPYDFMRKRLSVVVERDGVIRIITKGAFAHVLEVCAIDDDARAEATRHYETWCAKGIRVIAVATRKLVVAADYVVADERELELAGFITFVDRPKRDAAAALAGLRALGVAVKMITGDSRLVAMHVAEAVGLDASKVLTGAQLDELTEIALVRAVMDTTLFVEVDPNHKERIVRALRRGGAVVGFFGDGVNDTPAMHAADASISVEDAVDVAKATADFVLTQKGLETIRFGIEHGRRTFANTLKYILTTTSANLGNMLSMAVASIVLPFLPLTAGQILLNNFLSDVPAIGIASDSVDGELVDKPRRWDMRFIGRFMLSFGLLSSAFDALMFGVLLVGFGASVETFRTGWFVESLATELAIALVVRTQRRAWQSRPGRVLVVTTLATLAIAFAIPYLPFAGWLGFTALSPAMVVAIGGITLAYILAAEAMKLWFYRRSATR